MILGKIDEKEKAQISLLIEQEHKIIYDFLINKKIIEKIPEIKSDWINGIYSRYLLHKINDSKKLFTELKSIELENISIEDWNIDLIVSSENLESLFNFVYHPDFDTSGGLKVGFKNLEERARFTNNIQEAFTLISKIDYQAYLMIKSLLKCICPVYTQTPLKKGNVISFSADYCIGVIMFSPSPVILTAETIIHETLHCALHSYLKIYELVTDSTVRVKTPLREDLRPLLGLFHQSYVLSGLCGFYSKLLQSAPYAEMQNVGKRFSVHKEDYRESLKILEDNNSYITEYGLIIFNELTDDIKQYV